MSPISPKKVGIGLVGLVLLSLVLFAVWDIDGPPEMPPEIPTEEVGDEEIENEAVMSTHTTIGTSVQGRSIDAYSYPPKGARFAESRREAGGDRDTHLLFIGGIHGGYEWNSVLLSYLFMDYLEENPGVIPSNLRVTVIPSANPDGVYEVVGKEGRFTLADVPEGAGDGGVGRFNANDVDLNRNFACNWQPESTWRGNVVSAGSQAFSEPEAQAIRSFVQESNPRAVIFWHSQANAVYASECGDGPLPETVDVMNTYAQAAGYRAVESFDAYEVTGDAEGWLASIGIPAVTVELETHETVEWERNLAGVNALFEYYGQ